MKHLTNVPRFYWESQERSCRMFSCAQNGRRDTAGMKPMRFEECQCLACKLVLNALIEIHARCVGVLFGVYRFWEGVQIHTQKQEITY